MLLLKTKIEQLRIAKTPFLIAFSPVTLTLSVFTLVNFGFYVAQNSLSPVFLQKPSNVGGYGFTVLQNAECEHIQFLGTCYLTKIHSPVTCSPMLHSLFTNAS
jgi:hypothetical protein